MKKNTIFKNENGYVSNITFSHNDTIIIVLNDEEILDNRWSETKIKKFNNYKIINKINGDITNVKTKDIIYTLSNVCNLNCKYCEKVQHVSDVKNLNERLTFFKKDLETRINRNDEIEFIYFIGGEPLIHEDFLLEMLDMIPKHVEIKICTNATIKVDNVLNKLLEFNTFPRIHYSIDVIGRENFLDRTPKTEEIELFYNNMLHNLDLINKYYKKIRFCINSVITKNRAFNEYNFMRSLEKKVILDKIFYVEAFVTKEVINEYTFEKCDKWYKELEKYYKGKLLVYRDSTRTEEDIKKTPIYNLDILPDNSLYLYE